MRRLIGLDLNGWCDRVWRSWLVEEGLDVAVDGGVLVDGGYGGVAVAPSDATGGARASRGARRRGWIGGPQALLAPHGLGRGWGDIGAAPRPRLREPGLAPEERRHLMTAAIEALSDRADVAVLAIPDDRSCGEAEREALLAALRDARASRRMLVWRPVLALLAQGSLVGPEGRVLVVSQLADGLALQTLILRADGLRVPERREPGRPVGSPFGLRALEAAVAADLAARHPDARGLAEALPALGIATRCALGSPAGPALVRIANSGWVEVAPTLHLPYGPSGVPTDAALGADAVLLDSPAEGVARATLRAALEADLGRPVVAGAPEDVARGAFEAARRIAAGQPVHYDFLPQIETICDGAQGPHAFGLVEKGHRLRAGEVYRSRVPAEFRVPAHREAIKVWLRRQDEVPRLAEVPVPDLDAPAEVALTLEQVPAAGKARLTLRSPAWSMPQEVVWEDADEVRRDWDEIIAEQDRRPASPDRLVLPSSALAWQVVSLQLDRRAPLDGRWDMLASLLSRSSWTLADQSGHGLLFDSDGEPPEGASDPLVAWFDAAADQALQRVREAARARRQPPPGCLRFLTWMFRRCPRLVVEELLDATRRKVSGAAPHPFDGRSQVALWLQGLGRTAESAAEVRATWDVLFRYPDASWKRDQLACASFLVARSASGSAALTAAETDRLISIAVASLRQGLGRETYQGAFRYTPGLLTGLLRRRAEAGEPRRLLVGHDPIASDIPTLLRGVLDDMARRHPAQKARWQPQVKGILSYIEDGTGDSDLLLRIMDDPIDDDPAGGDPVTGDPY